REDRPLPGLLTLLELERRRLSRSGLRRRTCLFGTCPRDCPWDMAGMDTLLELFQAIRDRFAREIRRGAGDLAQRKLERQARIAALAQVLHGHGEQVAEPEHRPLADLVRLLAQPVARLLCDWEGVGHLAQVLHEQEMAQVLE